MTDENTQHHAYQVLFLVAAICLNLPPVALGIKGSIKWCDYFAAWLAANAALCLTNAIAALYIIQGIRKAELIGNETASSAVNTLGYETSSQPTSQEVDNTLRQLQNPDQLQQEHQAYQRNFWCFVHTTHSKHLRHLIRYDGFVSTYCIFMLFWLFWLSDGVERISRIDKAEADDLENCSGYHEDYVLYSFCMGFVYVAITISSLVMVHIPQKKTRAVDDKAVMHA